MQTPSRLLVVEGNMAEAMGKPIMATMIAGIAMLGEDIEAEAQITGEIAIEVSTWIRLHNSFAFQHLR